MISNALTIVPYVSLGKVKYGMTPYEVQQIWGEPNKTRIDSEKCKTDYFGSINVAYSSGNVNKVIHFGAGRKAVEVEVQGVKIFGESPKIVLKKLLKIEKNPYVFAKNILILIDLGIMLTGFLDEDEEEDDLAFSMFPKGAMDEFSSMMKPYKIPNL